jgi:arsenical pump membrane protein
MSKSAPDAQSKQVRTGVFGWSLGVAGVLGLIVSFATAHGDASGAATQDWSPFVLVTGLLLVGLVADEDGLFAASGNRLARVSSNGNILFLGSVLMIGVVTAVLNLDTSVAFLTPVLVYTARSRGGGEAPLLYGCLLLSNAGSLFLPGSNLTNLIVLGHLHMTGLRFFSHMWAPALAALVVTAGVVGFAEHRELQLRPLTVEVVERPTRGVGLVAVVLCALIVVVLGSPALPVMVVGLVATVIRLAKGKSTLTRVFDLLGLPVLIGLFGVAVTLGTLGRAWSGPTTLLAHLDIWSTAGVGAISTVLFNNLPAASLLAAHTPRHPFALLIGLNLGPNLCVTGSLAWLLWRRSARVAGAQPSLWRASRLGLWAVPLSMLAALSVLALTGQS